MDIILNMKYVEENLLCERYLMPIKNWKNHINFVNLCIFSFLF